MSANSNSVAKCILTAIIFFLMTVSSCIASDASEDQKAVIQGYKLVEKFYACLLLDKLTSTCNDIIDIDPHDEKDMPLVWDYIKSNRALFLTNRTTSKDDEFFKWSRKSVTYFNPRDPSKYTDGQLYISIIHTLPGRNSSGVFKEVSFPIEKSRRTEKYRIIFGEIKVNGIRLNYENDLIRDFDILKVLGFKDDKGNTFGKRENGSFK